MAGSDNKAALHLIQKNLDLPEAEINMIKAPGLDELHNYLTSAIRELLDTDFNRLLNALYRIDVSEQKVSEAINLEAPDKIAATLATMIIDRELQKVVTRKKYSDS